MAAAGLPFQFFDAIEGSTPDLPLSRWRFRIVSRRVPVAGELGCYASHRAVWRHCVAIGEPVVVLEDDFRLADDFATALPVIEQLTREYGLIRFESLHRPRRRLSLRPREALHRIGQRGRLTLYYVADVPTSMIGYAIAPAAAAALVDASTPLAAPVDRFLQRVWAHRVPVFGVEPPLVGPSNAARDSTIGLRTRSRNPLWLTLRTADSLWGQFRRRRFNREQLVRLQAGAVGRAAAPAPVGTDAPCDGAADVPLQQP